MDWTTCPEAAGPQGESDTSEDPGYFSDPRRPDNTMDAIRRCRAAELAADLGRATPADALVVS